MPYLCPVCGYPDLTEPPRSRSGGGSYEICPSCGFQFGVSDDDAGLNYETWRHQWQKGGMRWASKAKKAPPGWHAGEQLGNMLPASPAKTSAIQPASPQRQQRRRAK